MPRSSNDCINRESYAGHVLVEFCGKFTDLTLGTAFSSKFESGSTLPEFTNITTGLVLERNKRISIFMRFIESFPVM